MLVVLLVKPSGLKGEQAQVHPVLPPAPCCWPLCVAALLALAAAPGQLVAAVQMLIAALFACAFNLLAGQGVLSFGHAAYFGVGTFATIHAMNALGGARACCPPLMPRWWAAWPGCCSG